MDLGYTYCPCDTCHAITDGDYCEECKYDGSCAENLACDNDGMRRYAWRESLDSALTATFGGE